MRNFADLTQLAEFDAIIDVRTPAEFADDHLPGALNMPVLYDDQRQVVGALHNKNAFAGRKYGAGLVTANISTILSDHLAAVEGDWKPLVYCWRGGMRSGALVEVMNRVGWQAASLQGGYKTYRNWVIKGVASLPQKLNWQVLCGPTGAGKTIVLNELATLGEQVLDLEDLAKHRGSVFGDSGHQPTQRWFESLLRSKLNEFDPARPVFVESESRKIGQLQQPVALHTSISNGNRIWLETNRSLRAELTVGSYAEFFNRDRFSQILARLHRHCSNADRQGWLQLHNDREFKQLAESMLENYYDPKYQHALAKRTAKPQELRLELQSTTKAEITALAQKIKLAVSD